MGYRHQRWVHTENPRGQLEAVDDGPVGPVSIDAKKISVPLQFT